MNTKHAKLLLACGLLLLAAVMLSLLSGGCASKEAGPVEDPYADMEKRSGRAEPEVTRFAKEFFDTGLKAYEKGEYERAVELWRKAIRSGGPGFPYRARSYFNIGLAYLRMGRYEWARDELIQAATLEPDNYDIHFTLANTYIHLENYDEAAAALERCTDLRGDSPEVYNTLGVCRLNSGDYPGAEQAFLMALALQPGYPEALSNLEIAHRNQGAELFEQGNYSEAVERYSRAAEINPSNGKNHYDIARAYLMMGEFEKAIEAYRKAHQIAPELAEQEGSNLLSEYAQEAGSDPEILVRMAELYMSRKQFEAAATEYTKAIAASPKEYDLYLKLARLYADNLNDRASAVQWYHAFLSANPDDPRAASIRREIAKEMAPPPDPDRVPEMAAMAAGLAYDPQSRSVVDPGDRFPVGSRVYRVARIRNLWGKHVVIRRLIRPSGKVQYEENITKEFFEDEVVFTSVDRCSSRGTWKHEWTVDGVKLGTLVFVIY